MYEFLCEGNHDKCSTEAISVARVYDKTLFLPKNAKFWSSFQMRATGKLVSELFLQKALPLLKKYSDPKMALSLISIYTVPLPCGFLGRDSDLILRNWL